MIPQNARPASATTTRAAAGGDAPAPISGQGLSNSDARRGTYTPSRPSGVHPRELGLTK